MAFGCPAIFDVSTNAIINRSKRKTVIGNHVWVARGVSILKDVVISNNSIIGANSIVVNKVFDEDNVIIAGAPAKVVKKGISWSRENLDSMSQNLSQ